MIALFLPDWLTVTNFLIGIFVFLLMVAGLVIGFIVKGRKEVSSLQLDRATAAEALVGTRDAELVTLKKKLEEAEEELESLTAEHRMLVGISIAKLMEFWAEKESLEATLRDTQRDLRIEKRRRDGDT